MHLPTAAAGRPALGFPFFYGYLVAAACFLAMTLSTGMGFYSYSIFMAPLQQEFGWSSAQVSAAISFNVASGFAAPFIGVLVDRWGARRMMLTFTPIVAIAYLLRGGITDLWQLYALQVLGALGQSGETGIVLGLILSRWFVRRRGRMVGFAMMGANFGGMIFSPLTGILIQQFGWRMTYVLFGVATLAILMPVFYLVIRNAPHEMGLTPDGLPEGTAEGPSSGPQQAAEGVEWTGGQAIRTVAFWAVVAGLAAGQVGLSGVLLMQVSHLVNIGIDIGSASVALGFSAFFGMLGKAIFGYLTERIPARYAVMLALLFQAGGIAVLTNVREVWHLIFFVPIFGLGFGSMGALQPLIVGQTFGLRSFGAVFGAMALFTSGASAIAPPLAGAVRDATGSYTGAFTLFAGLMLLGILMLFLARPPRSAPEQAETKAAGVE